MKNLYSCKTIIVLALAFFSFSNLSHAQLTINAQIRPRAEYRDGVGTLTPKDLVAGNNDTSVAGFISQRSRLSLLYKFEKVSMGLSIQDIRVWGQDASTINNADGSKLGIHEAWAEVILSDSMGLSLKAGRQELLYDDSRLLGNLDWLQQGRRHDAAVFKINKKGWQVDLGLAYNQSTDAFNTFNTFYTAGNTPPYLTVKGTAVTIPSGFVPTNGLGGAPTLASAPSTNGGNQMYKTMQYLYAAKTIDKTKISALIFKDDFGKFRVDSLSAGTEKVYGRRYDVSGSNSRITAGALAVGAVKKFNFSVGAYFQTGKDRDGKDLSAYNLTAYGAYTKGKMTIGLGYELLSGDDITTPTTESHRFDPLYGTPHKFWGLMDYWYVGTGSPAAGLSNPYLRLKYAASPKFTATLDVHQFSLANAFANKVADATGNTMLDKNMGYETDLILNYNMSKSVAFEFGYCMMLGNNSLEVIKRNTIDKANQTAVWSYLMITFKPELLKTEPVKK
jgi:Alginate export